MTLIERPHSFCGRISLNLPIIMGPLATASPPALAAAVANTGGLGASAAQIGTALLRSLEAAIYSVWSGALSRRWNAAQALIR